MKYAQIPLGPLQTNCYVLTKENGTCLIIDPGGDGEKLIQAIKENQLKPIALILTHAHFDHIGAVDEVREEFAIPVYIHEKEAAWLLDPILNGSQSFQMGQMIRVKPADKIIVNEEQMQIGEFKFQVFETPGHSPGSLSFYFKEEGMVVAGDALFNGSIGRTDLRGGNHEQLLKSIHEKLLTLPEETVVLPGHGPETTIGHEMDGNPFLNGF
ncbi:MBL fold metallo-hydrolase [Cytobacillus purgationiresistens]|uniref:Glyoxylase-like metal-dependent hydrolase (Beta-lactamase superfamily II) n=1 Tax=Cytobacillus purgationiresistens TaxID=863449 RepID=A0ABU0ADW0_9BACI|nr:MBL fold metallo-hydrolase [Cytobacillus purgationiresistens]MDQ0269432.1 glyoxylase-like metal-dependent hydrolase (beta-lactamase superfamily II) [Cytobacillus purgationiresistens]